MNRSQVSKRSLPSKVPQKVVTREEATKQFALQIVSEGSDEEITELGTYRYIVYIHYTTLQGTHQSGHAAIMEHKGRLFIEFYGGFENGKAVLMSVFLN